MKADKKSFWQRLKRIVQFRLIVPLKRSQHPPEFTARGVLVGMMWAMTPLVGIQMTTVLLTWLAAKKFFKWDFSLPIAVAWTWVTNVVTMGPVYYVFYLTGKLMMFDFDNVGGFVSFTTKMKEAFQDSPSIWEIGKAIMTFFHVLMQEWGLPMAIGCIPWSIFLGWLSYKWTLRWLKNRESRKANREERRRFWREKLHQVNEALLHPTEKKKRKKHGKKRSSLIHRRH